MTIEITRYDPNKDPNKASVIASFDFKLALRPPVTLRNWRLIRTKSGGMFVAAPSYKGEDEQWRPLVEFEGDSQKNLCNKLLELCEPYIDQPKAPPVLFTSEIEEEAPF